MREHATAETYLGLVRECSDVIPVLRTEEGLMAGVEAVIDKDSTAALLARDLHADALLLLTDVDAVYRDFGGPHETSIGATTPTLLETLPLASGSMGPKVGAAIAFVRSGGRFAGIGQLSQARAILEERAGTRLRPDPKDPRTPHGFHPKTSGFIGADQPISVWADDGGGIV